MEKSEISEISEKYEISENFNLKNFNTFKITSKAKFFSRISSQKQLIFTLKLAKNKNLPVFILGNGSNIVFLDKKINAFFIKLENNKLKIKNSREVVVSASKNISELLNFCLKNNLSGMEFLAGIPGTIGGAIFGNAGAFGKEIKDILKEITIFPKKPPFKKETIKLTLKNKNKLFSYRNSFLKKTNNYIIWEASFGFLKGNKKKIQLDSKKFVDYRLKNQPYNMPSAGSFFKNVSLESFPKNIQKQLKNQKIVNKGYVPAGYLIEKTGLKGTQIGDAQVSLKHANFIVNLGKATGKDIYKLKKLIAKKVKNKFKVILEPEVRIVNSRGEIIT